MAMTQSDEPHLLQDSLTLRLRSRALSQRALDLQACSRILRRRARTLCAEFARRAQHSAYLRPLVLRGGSEASGQDGAAPALPFCPICGLAVKPGDAVLSLQANPTHVDCAYPRTARVAPCATKRQVDRKIIVVKDTLTGRGLMLAVHRTMAKVKTQEGPSVWVPESMEVTTRDGQVVDRVAPGVYRLDGRTYQLEAVDAP